MMKTVEKQGNMIKMTGWCMRQLCVFALLFGLLMIFSGCEKSEEEIDSDSVITYEFVTESLPEKAMSLLKEEEEKLRIKREEEEKEKAELEAEEAKKYHFIDVCQEDYEMVIDEDAKVNPYNNDCFTYTTTDAKGKELVFDKPMILTETGIPLGYRGVISYEDEKYTSRFGVDVSRHLGNINWAKAKEAGVEFAIVRIGFRGYGKSGQINKDVKALDNIKGAKDAGIDVGVYFFSQAINEEEAIEEAEFVLNELNGIELEMPKHIICRNTAECMQSGVLFGHVGMIEYIVEHMKEEIAKECGFEPGSKKITVVATGGLSSMIAEYTDVIDFVDKRLTLTGLELIYEKNK